jgi:hypothetical protein
MKDLEEVKAIDGIKAVLVGTVLMKGEGFLYEIHGHS